MKEKKYIINRPDPESTVGLAISTSIEMAKKNDKKVITYLRGTACVVSKDTRLADGISKFRRAAERFTRARD